MVESEALVPSFVKVTLAPLTGAPEVSVTVPRMVPASTCAWRGCALKNVSSITAAIANHTRRIQVEIGFRFITDPPKALYTKPRKVCDSGQPLDHCKGTRPPLANPCAYCLCGQRPD